METKAENTAYPGAIAKPSDVLRLAEEYRKAADVLYELGRRRDPISRAPYRLTAIHAIELFLNAYLAHVGLDGNNIRKLQHNMAERAALCVTHGLVLRKRTKEHLSKLADNREYLVARYAPEQPSILSEVNRLRATLTEVAAKVSDLVR